MIPDEEILERAMLPIVNEAARILQEGIAFRSVDIDIIFINGFGWPAYRGRPMFWADSLRLPKLCDKLAHYAAITGDSDFQPPPLIERLAAKGRSFASLGSEGAEPV